MNNNFSISNDILTISYYIKKNNWKDVSKTNYQRILYFSTVLAPIFVPDYKWTYYFSNTIFGPYNSEISDTLKVLSTKNFISITERNISSNRVYENYLITVTGEKFVENVILKVEHEKQKYYWFNTIVKVLSIYGSEFLVKLVKSDPNINAQNKVYQKSKIYSDNSDKNLSKEFFVFLKDRGLSTHTSSSDEDYLLIFFDVLYRKYKGGL